VYYDGTIAQWNSISKGDYNHLLTRDTTTLHCLDQFVITYETESYAIAPSRRVVRASNGTTYALTTNDLPILEASGYTFNGWLLHGSLVSVGDVINADTTFTASWSVATETFTISYSTAYGTAPTSKSVTVNKGESYILTANDLPTLSVTGMVFNGWLINGAIASVGTAISANTRLIASWSAATKTITISYSTAHGTAPNRKSVTVNVGESYSLTANDLPILTAEGYIFSGWVINGEIISVGYKISADTVLVAVWVEDLPDSMNDSISMF
jgi:uncharacterized repeat protein (TIGR02543 family)